ncbi:hypothetical protein [Tomitella biformata]|nr:hypothetical protein [Tomitella biformata]
MSDEAVQGWVRAYRKYAETMEGIAEEIERQNHTTFFGDLDSLRQLAAGYDQLMYGGQNSLHQRVLEFAAAATQFADNLQRDWLAILAEDGQTATSLSTVETP